MAKFFMISIFTLFSMVALSQTKKVAVMSIDGNLPLMGVNIQDQEEGYITDEYGFFTISLNISILF